MRHYLLRMRWHGMLDAILRPFDNDEKKLFEDFIDIEKSASDQKIIALHDEIAKKSDCYRKIRELIDKLGELPYISTPLMMFVGILSENVNEATMWAFTLSYMLTTERRRIDLQVWNEWFEQKLPTISSLFELWTKQKGYKMSNMNPPPFINWTDNLDNWPRPDMPLLPDSPE